MEPTPDQLAAAEKGHVDPFGNPALSGPAAPAVTAAPAPEGSGPAMFSTATGASEGQPMTQAGPAPQLDIRMQPETSVAQRNPKAVAAIAVAVGYILLAAATGIVLLGIVPVMLSIRSFQRGEKLAPVALAAAVVAVLFALSALGHR
jgi:hypothetical protein